jgi:hypothetical protein
MCHTSMPDTIEDIVEQLRGKAESGNYLALIEAFRWCALNDVPLPDWLSEAVLTALVFTFHKGGAKGRGKTGGHLKQAQRAENATIRYRAAAAALEIRKYIPILSHADEEGPIPGTAKGAFEYASRQLRGTPAWGSADTIEETYYEEKKKHPR